MACRISTLLLETPPPDEEKHLERMALRRLSEDDVPHLGSASLQTITWSIVSGFKGLENDVIILAALTDIETDWHRGVAYVGMSRARTRLHVIIHEDCDGKRREREVEWEARGKSNVEMVPWGLLGDHTLQGAVPDISNSSTNQTLRSLTSVRCCSTRNSSASSLMSSFLSRRRSLFKSTNPRRSN